MMAGPGQDRDDRGTGPGAKSRDTAVGSGAVRPAEDRLAAARRLLEREGVPGEVRLAGMEDEIAAVRGEPGLRERLAVLAPEMRSLGFRYVALEPDEAHHHDEDT